MAIGIFEDLTGRTYGKWKVLERAENGNNGETRWLCECGCDNKTQKIIDGKYLKNGASKSCGCSFKDKRNKTKIYMQNKQLFGRWKILKLSHYDKWDYWLCQCQCEHLTEKIVSGVNLRNGQSKSCGCIGSENNKENFTLPDDKGSINKIIRHYKQSAKRRNMIWDLSYQEVKNIIHMPCYYCGEEKSNSIITDKHRDGYKYNGIDRVDNSIGYISSNVVPCCSICNYAKRDMSQKDFLLWANKVARFKDINTIV